jgi:hypothetical protein
MRRGLFLGAVVLVLTLPAAALASTPWMPIPAKLAPKLRSGVMQPAVKAMGGGMRITACSFQQRHRFYACVYGTRPAPKKGAVEVERTKRCEYVLFDVDLTGKKPKVVRHTYFHRCY